MNNTVVLLDIDYTLFNTDSFRDSTYPKLMEILRQEDTLPYHEQVKEIEKALVKKGSFEPMVFAKTLATTLQIPGEKKEIEDLFYNPDLYKSCLYSDVSLVLKTLSQAQDIIVGIISQGERSFQERKIASLRHYFLDENVFISEDKLSFIDSILNKYKNRRLYVVDDSSPFLKKVQQQSKEVFTYLIERENRYEGREKIENFHPSKVIKSLNELLTDLE